MNTVNSSKYLIDANVFIQAKNFHYRFEFCQGFWDWLIAAHQANLVFSLEKVKKELQAGNKSDKLNTWIKSKALSNFFLPDDKDKQVMAAYGEVMNWIKANEHYKLPAKETFMDSAKADAFLIAAAKSKSYAVVTQEEKKPDQKKRVPLPDAAHQLGVKTLTIY